MSRIYEDIDPVYATACSDVTLCSNSKGFFKNMAEELVSIAEADGWLKTFEDIEERKKIVAVMEKREIMDALNEVLSRIQPLHRSKDARISQERREAAKAALKEGDLVKALGLASQAVLRAPVTGDEEAIDSGVSLALALWLRSEVLLLSDKPKAALEDLKLALKERLPAKMRGQYYWRMGHCYRGAGEPTRAKVSYELAARLLGHDKQAKSQLAKDIASLNYSIQPEQPSDKIGIALTGGSKLNMPALSKLLNISEEENKGRFAVAGAPIKTGDVILVDTPYAACLLPEYYGTHCLHCFKRLEDMVNEAPVWCPKCSGVAFCSIKCRDIAISNYHLYECQYIDLFIGSGMSILSHIALRMVTQAGLDTSLSMHDKYISNNVKTVEATMLNDIEGTTKKSKTKKGLRRSTEKNSRKESGTEAKTDDKMTLKESLELKSAQIYSLCTHSAQRKGQDYLKRTVMAIFLKECLKKAGFFKPCNQDDTSKEEIQIVELIVRNLQLLQFNAHEIYETLRGEHKFSGSKINYIGVGIYPTGALFNHECYPSVARYFEGQKIVLRSIRPLQPGDVVSENYGLNFLIWNLKARQRTLACRYWFRCECNACKEDWPTLKELNSTTPPYLRCPNIACSGKFRGNLEHLLDKCVKCSTPIDKKLVKINLETVKRCVHQFQKGAKLMDEERTEEATSVLCEAMDLYHEVATAPYHDIHLAQEALRTCFAAYGNVHVVRSGKRVTEDTTTTKDKLVAKSSGN